MLPADYKKFLRICKDKNSKDYTPALASYINHIIVKGEIYKDFILVDYTKGLVILKNKTIHTDIDDIVIVWKESFYKDHDLRNC